MKNIFLLIFLLSAGSVFAQNPKIEEQIDIENLKKHLLVLSHDSMEGRNTATAGQLKAAKYIAAQLQDFGVQKFYKDSTAKLSWFQDYDFVKKFGDKTKYEPLAQNVIGMLEGSGKLKEEFIILSAHYDHLGIRDSLIYNGADDNGTGTSALLEMARYFAAEYEQDKEKDKRSLLFIFFSGEEKGLLGSKHYVKHPAVPLEKCKANLNVDMIGRADSAHAQDSNYLYLIGSDRLSQTLHQLSEETNEECCKLELDYKFNDPEDKLQLYYRSDHYNFAKEGIPVIFYFSGLHPDYHKSTDDFEKINLEMLQKRTILILETAKTLIDYPEDIVVDGEVEGR